MKTYQFNRLFAVAAIATLAVACGTSSPTGPDVTSDATVSALRAGSAVPPPAPQPVPLPEPLPSPRAEPSPDPMPDSLPSGDVRQPAGTPTDDTGVDTSPNADGPSGDQTPQPSPDPSPNPGPEGPAGGTTPPASGDSDDVQCLAASVEIMPLVTFAGTNGTPLEAMLTGKDGLAITDSSCESLVWEVEGNRPRVIIEYGANSRFVSISGPAGPVTIRATTPNGVSASLVVVLQ